MEKRDLIALVQRLSRHFPEARVKPPMIVFPPLHGILKGLYLERSASDAERFYLWVFFMPLCVPTQHVAFNFGRRISGDDQRWDFRDPQLVEKVVFAIKSEALPFLENVGTPHEAARFTSSLANETESPHVHQAKAYLLARCGETAEASKALDVLLSSLDRNVSWQAQMAHRAQHLKMLLVNRPNEATALLQGWELETIHNLGLDGIGFTIATE